MKKRIAFASGIRLHAMLCCGAAVLLSACGAGVGDPVNGIQSHTAAELTSSTAQPAANTAAMPDGAEATPAPVDAAAPGSAAATQAPSAATQAPSAAAPGTPAAARASTSAANIEPAYDSKRQATVTSGFSDQAETPVPAAQEIAATACEPSTCQH